MVVAAGFSLRNAIFQKVNRAINSEFGKEGLIFFDMLWHESIIELKIFIVTKNGRVYEDLALLKVGE